MNATVIKLRQVLIPEMAFLKSNDLSLVLMNISLK